MRADDLVRMSTQIAQFWEPYPADDAVVGVAEHLRNFWDPGMRRELEQLADTAAPRLHPLALQAIRRLAADRRA